jgi:hypothetical protein
MIDNGKPIEGHYFGDKKETRRKKKGGAIGLSPLIDKGLGVQRNW